VSAPGAIDRLPIGRNTALLSAALAANSAMLQLSAAVASLTLVLVIDAEGLLGLGPAIVLASGALAALPAGRAMDRVGRVPVLAAGFGAGAAGCALAAAGSAAEAPGLVLAGRLGVGGASGTALLSRTAAGDMYPPERRARGIALRPRKRPAGRVVHPGGAVVTQTLWRRSARGCGASSRRAMS
jgi:MFS family permease